MRWQTACAVVVLGTGPMALAQPIFTADNLDEAMKGIGRQFGLVTAAITSKDFDTAKVRVARAREQLSPTTSFWKNNEREDAIRMVRDATARLDDLDSVLSAITIDPAAADAAAREVATACQACHTVYREQDPTTDTFRLKPGSLE